jgi:hypothetical protein
VLGTPYGCIYGRGLQGSRGGAEQSPALYLATDATCVILFQENGGLLCLGPSTAGQLKSNLAKCQRTASNLVRFQSTSRSQEHRLKRQDHRAAGLPSEARLQTNKMHLKMSKESPGSVYQINMGVLDGLDNGKDEIFPGNIHMRG